MTVALTKVETQIVWRSADVGDKTVSIPGSAPVNKGYDLDIGTTIADGSTYVVTPLSGTIDGQPSFSFTLPDGETCNLALRSDADNLDWIIRCLCCTPSIPVTFTVGAVAFRGQTFLWNFPAMSASPDGAISFWIKVQQSQLPFPGIYTPDIPDGDLFNLNTGYIIAGPAVTNLDAFFIGQGVTHNHVGNDPALRHVNPITDITSANPAVITFTHPHGIPAGAVFLTFFFDQSGWVSGFNFKYLTAASVTSTTITTDFDASGFPAYDASAGTMGSPGPNSAALLQVFNALDVNFTDSTEILDFSYDTVQPLASSAWINVLGSWQTNHAAGAKIMTLYYGETPVAQDGSFPSGASINEFDTNTSFSIPFDTPSLSEMDSWMIGGNSTTNEVSGNIICDMAEFWFAPGQFLDFTDAGVRAKFHDGSNKPVSLGTDGSLPTGVAPTLYLSISHSETNANNFASNLSGAGALTVAGAGLTIAPTSPSD